MKPKLRKTLRFLIPILLILLLLFLAYEFLWHRSNVLNSHGSQLYKAKKYDKAEQKYRSNSLNTDNDDLSERNLAKSLYQKGQYADAAKTLNNSINKNADQATAGDWYDLGNMLYQQKDYESALKAYQNAILKDPKDQDVKANYELALKMQQQKQEQNKPKDQDKEKDKPKENQDIMNKLKALDQKESYDRRKEQQPSSGGSGKWW
ncbi:MAG: hypothetical protein CVU48_10420 [Candidatus Cloacimonetes bacterium HGW-Cloacimonetes-1]|jgi:tetratricopeptide (TPR) repeat protein|nr:MAG: hypothetical protein CVU48_10420 [Candidatus Cloacimonetes bacterium HGW-Cloacimonetes-1]